MIVWLDGVFVPDEEARIDPRDRGFLLGDGVFETLAVVHGRVRALPAHLTRLRRAAHVIGLRLPRTDHELRQAVAATVETNGLAAEPAVVRITLTRGVGPPGLLPPRRRRQGS